jgi:prevent-host-death family protein
MKVPTPSLRLPNSVDATTAKNSLGELLDEAHFGDAPLLVTKRNDPWAVNLRIDTYGDLLDQLDTMAEQLNPEFQNGLQQSMEEYRRGDVGTLEDIRRTLKRRKGKERA